MERASPHGPVGVACGVWIGIWNDSGDRPASPRGTQDAARAAKKTGEETSWIKICMKDQKTGDKQICLVKHEALEPKTGAVLIAAAVRSVEGEDKQHLFVNLPTAYSLVMPTGVQIKIDEGEPIQLQYSVCLPTNCQVQMELSKDMSDKMRTGKQMFVAALNAQQKTMAFPIPLKGFVKASDGAPVDAAAYQEARAQMIQASRQHQLELGKKAAATQQEKQRAVGQPQVAPPAAPPQ